MQSHDNIAYKQHAKIDSEGITLRMGRAGYAGPGNHAMLRPGNIGLKRSEGKEGKPADKPGSVKALRPTTAIPLGRELLPGSSHLPASSAGHVIACLFGVAPGAGCLVSPPTQLPTPGLVSVALLLASRRAVISRHPTLWSPDFPLRTVRTIVEARFIRAQRLSGRLPDAHFTPSGGYARPPSPAASGGPAPRDRRGA